jgi:hypothetical protein
MGHNTLTALAQLVLLVKVLKFSKRLFNLFFVKEKCEILINILFWMWNFQF